MLVFREVGSDGGPLTQGCIRAQKVRRVADPAPEVESAEGTPVDTSERDRDDTREADEGLEEVPVHIVELMERSTRGWSHPQQQAIKKLLLKHADVFSKDELVQVYPPLEYPPLDALTPPMSPAPHQPLTPPPEVMDPPTAPPPSPGQLTLRRSAIAAQRARSVTSRPASGQIDSSSGSDTAPADSTKEVWV